MDKEEIIPLHIEDEYVRNYLWERALIAIDDPCTKSHPHENMNEYCQHKTKDEPVALVAEVHISRYTIEWTNGPLPEGTKLYTTPQRTWVGLTKEEINQGLLRSFYVLEKARAWRDGVAWAEEILKRKNYE